MSELQGLLHSDALWNAQTMAGTIFLATPHRPEHTWSAASWLFYNVIEQLADAATSPDLRRTLKEIKAQNLGALSLDDLKSLRPSDAP